MRLHRLWLHAFGPYATEQVIDFERLARSGLFLLEGPTGAGKTTILDAITFALYGGLAGESASDDRLASHFAGPAAEPSVTCEFSIRGTVYRVTRVPAHTRPKKRGEGRTPVPARVHLARRDGAGWATLSANKAEAGALIGEIVGLNRDQFTQVMLLPQGEFARFLQCGDDERRAVLTKLFGTGLYDRITDQLDRRRAAAMREREQSARMIAAAVSAAAEAAGLSEEARAELLGLPAAEQAVRLKEVSGEAADAVTVTADGLAGAQALRSAAAAAERQARRTQELMARLTRGLAELRAHEETQPEHERRATALAAARQAEPVRPLLAGLAEAEDVVAEARQALARLPGGPQALAEVDGPAAPGGSGRPGAAPAGAAAQVRPEAAGAWEEAAESARAGAARAGQAAQAAAARAERASAEEAALRHLAGQESGLAGQRAALAALAERAAAAADEVAKLEQACQELPGRIAELDAGRQRAQLDAGAIEAARVRLESVTRQHEAATRAAGLRPRLELARAALADAVDQHQHLVDRHQELVQARLAGIAAELAASLAAGRPCPVCGAREHPGPAASTRPAVPAGEVDEAARRRDEAGLARREREREHSLLAREEAACAALATGRDAGGLAAELAALAAQIKAAREAEREAARLAGELAAARAALEASAGELRDASGRAAAAAGQVATARQALAATVAELAEAAAGHPSVAARQSALRAAAGAGRDLAQGLQRLASALATAAATHERAAREAAARGFGSFREARAAVLPPAGQAALATRVDAWSAKLASLAAAVRDEELAGLDERDAGAANEAATAAAGALAAAEQAEQAARRAHDEAAGRAGRFAERLAEVQRAEAAHEALAEATEPVIRLAGLAKGVEGHRRVALTTYVLRHWFARVVAAANIRLSAMSSGRYELARTDRAESRRERSGLTLAVIDRHTGEARSPASLSGGETFYTSLALALGLADVVRAEAGGVDLDTLFIDEGFGSLDAQTLEEVMAVIDDLRDRGRVVGIVSHVADLKDRVPERLEVRRLPDGSSAVRVVA